MTRRRQLVDELPAADFESRADPAVERADPAVALPVPGVFDVVGVSVESPDLAVELLVVGLAAPAAGAASRLRAEPLFPSRTDGVVVSVADSSVLAGGVAVTAVVDANRRLIAVGGGTVGACRP